MSDAAAIMREIDRALSPAVMSKAQAIEFLELLVDEIETRIEALTCEVSDAE